MTDVRRLMGRLNPSTAQFGGGRGGIPELTPQDIAGALGMIGDDLAREVFCACWWPDGARLTRNALLAMVGLRQRAEIDRQWRQVQMLRLDLHIADDDMASGAATSPFAKEIRDRIKSRLDGAKASCWPSQPKMYSIIRAAVIDEMAAPNLCRVCEGRGETTVGNLTIMCKQCDGVGSAPVSDRQRAARIERDESTYRREWRVVYEWTYALVSEAEGAAMKALRAALQRDAA